MVAVCPCEHIDATKWSKLGNCIKEHICNGCGFNCEAKVSGFIAKAKYDLEVLAYIKNKTNIDVSQLD